MKRISALCLVSLALCIPACGWKKRRCCGPVYPAAYVQPACCPTTGSYVGTDATYCDETGQAVESTEGYAAQPSTTQATTAQADMADQDLDIDEDTTAGARSAAAADDLDLDEDTATASK